MSIRLNKVLTELNIGLQTAVDFLKERKELGEIKEDATSNTKISDEQHEALVKAFKGDKAVKNEAERIIAQKAKDKEKKVEKKPVTKAEDLLAPKPTFKTVGKIDLDSLKPKKNKEEVPVTAGEETLQTAAESLPTNPVAEEKPAPQHTEVAAHASEKEEAKPQPVEEKVEEAPLPVKETQAEAPHLPRQCRRLKRSPPPKKRERQTMLPHRRKSRKRKSLPTRYLPCAANPSPHPR